MERGFCGTSVKPLYEPPAVRGELRDASWNEARWDGLQDVAREGSQQPRGMMTQPEQEDMKYLPRQCRFLDREVWAILTKQPEGTWRVVNCLDKDTVCFQHECVLTTDGGEWPFVERDTPPAGSA